MAQTAIQQAIYRAARVAGLVPDSWTVILSVPYPGVTIYGDSLSAMVSLSVLALAKGETIPIDRVMTGSVSPNGQLPRSGRSLKSGRGECGTHQASRRPRRNRCRRRRLGYSLSDAHLSRGVGRRSISSAHGSSTAPLVSDRAT